jgi:Glycosyl transferase family 11
MSLVFIPSDGFGNLMFQHHAAYAYAKENGLELCAVGYYYDTRPKMYQYARLFSHVKLLGSPENLEETYEYKRDPQRWRIENAVRLSGQTAVYVEPGHTYHPIPPGARVLSGYFQSWKYFDAYRIEIRDLLRSNESELWERQKAKYTGGVCVHVRWGGDGKVRPHIHPITSKMYYEKAMSLFPGARFLVFAEPDAGIQDWDEWKGRDVTFIDEPDPLPTLFLMSLCEHFIIANSSLSLSAYYMRENESARLVIPSDWFGPKGPQFSLDDLADRATII